MSAHPSDGASLRVYRGGGWYYVAGCCRAAYRNWHVPSVRYVCLGFRPVKRGVR